MWLRSPTLASNEIDRLILYGTEDISGQTSYIRMPRDHLEGRRPLLLRGDRCRDQHKNRGAIEPSPIQTIADRKLGMESSFVVVDEDLLSRFRQLTEILVK